MDGCAIFLAVVAIMFHLCVGEYIIQKETCFLLEMNVISEENWYLFTSSSSIIAEES